MPSTVVWGHNTHVCHMYTHKGMRINKNLCANELRHMQQQLAYISEGWKQKQFAMGPRKLMT